ncbi:thiamine-phosphate pyrophosphorylase [Pseudorhizobium tarimense]|uniref:Thiamine-phosphate synthase n=2 Tax=Pseudorhizobium tarimense TaxID=1079109 RepID=A0ABV2H4T2_9HYPH|nr:thiamine phosphate synthase [Pseudorhizobium tarimense]
MVETARLAVAGGATVVQLRDKQADTNAMIECGLALKSALAGTGVPLIVNDDVEAAIAISAEGLHVGQGDLGVTEVRRQIPAGMILGLSVGTVELAQAVDPQLVDYVGVGPVFATRTKLDHKTPIGFDGLARIARAVPVPTVAIGGLKEGHAAQVLAAGADGLAVVSAICGTTDPQAAARKLAIEIREASR